MPCQRRFMIRTIASYGKAVFHFPAFRFPAAKTPDILPFGLKKSIAVLY